MMCFEIDNKKTQYLRENMEDGLIKFYRCFDWNTKLRYFVPTIHIRSTAVNGPVFRYKAGWNEAVGAPKRNKTRGYATGGIYAYTFGKPRAKSWVAWGRFKEYDAEMAVYAERKDLICGGGDHRYHSRKDFSAAEYRKARKWPGIVCFRRIYIFPQDMREAKEAIFKLEKKMAAGTIKLSG